MWQPGWEGGVGENGYMYMAESLHCSSETITTLFTGCSPPKNGFGVKNKRFHMLQLRSAAAKLLQSCPTLCDPIDGSPPGSSVPGILQGRILEWIAISLSATKI